MITAVGVLIAIVGLRQAQRQRLRQFESLYVRRFWDLLDGLTLAALKGEGEPPVDDQDQRIVRAYLRLCEDELELRREGWISHATWRVWAAGMSSQLRRYPFDAVWAEVRQEAAQRAEDAFCLLRQYAADGNVEDPCVIRGWRAFIRGLTGSPG